MALDWSAINPLTPGAALSVGAGQAAEDVTTGGLGAVAIAGLPSAIDPSGVLFWFAAFAGATLGLIGASTHLRIGPFKAGADLGKD